MLFRSDEGLMFSFPSRVEHGKFCVVEGVELNAYSTEKFNATLNELRSERDAVKDLGLLISDA